MAPFGREPAPGPAGTPAAPGTTEAARGPGAGYADPRTQGGQALRAYAEGGRTQSGQQPWGQTIPPWSSGTSPQTGGAPAAWSGGPREAAVARGAGGAARTEEDPTRRRAPVRLDPWGQAGEAAQIEDDPTRTRGPARLAPREVAVPGAGAEFPEFQPGGREGTTMARPSALQPDGQAGGQAGGETAGEAAARAGRARPGGRVLGIAAGVLVVAVAAVLFFTLGRGQGQPGSNPAGAGQPTVSGGEQDALGPGATAPGQPTVTARSAGGTQVRFSWTYANRAAGDTFRWHRVSGTAGAPDGVTSKPGVVISLPPGQSVCVEVQVRRAGGQASDASLPACWPS